MNPVRVLLADDHPVVREGLKALIGAEPNLIVVGEASDGRTAISLADSLDPDLAVIEAALPDLQGPELMARLRERAPKRKILVLTGREDNAYHQLLLRAGAEACIQKKASIDDLLRMIRQLAGAGITHYAASTQNVVNDTVARSLEADLSTVSLSERESEVVRLISLGYSNKEIASLLELSVKTVETYKARSMEKLGSRRRVDIVRYAAKRGWLEKV